MKKGEMKKLVKVVDYDDSLENRSDFYRYKMILLIILIVITIIVAYWRLL